MREFTANENDKGLRLDKFVRKVAPGVPESLLYKYIRLKRIKVNGGRAARDYRLLSGDVVSLYINDEFFEARETSRDFTRVSPDFQIVYEDQNLLLVDKKPGLVVHEDDEGTKNTLINQIKAHLFSKGEWDPESENSFTPALCNRIDRNTGGIVIAAKNALSLRILNEKIKNREIRKYYLCLIHGAMKEKTGELSSYIFKDERLKRVYSRDRYTPGAKTAVTRYKTLSEKDGLSLLECELITGRTHQIRAQFAAAGHPLLGDGKYGKNENNRSYLRKYQALYAYKIKFDFKTPGDTLDYLNHRAYSVKAIDFKHDYETGALRADLG